MSGGALFRNMHLCLQTGERCSRLIYITEFYLLIKNVFSLDV